MSASASDFRSGALFDFSYHLILFFIEITQAVSYIRTYILNIDIYDHLPSSPGLFGGPFHLGGEIKISARSGF
jgi:hypothetical protein